MQRGVGVTIATIFDDFNLFNNEVRLRNRSLRTSPVMSWHVFFGSVYLTRVSVPSRLRHTSVSSFSTRHSADDYTLSNSIIFTRPMRTHTHTHTMTARKQNGVSPTRPSTGICIRYAFFFSRAHFFGDHCSR